MKRSMLVLVVLGLVLSSGCMTTDRFPTIAVLGTQDSADLVIQPHEPYASSGVEVLMPGLSACLWFSLKNTSERDLLVAIGPDPIAWTSAIFPSTRGEAYGIDDSLVYAQRHTATALETYVRLVPSKSRGVVMNRFYTFPHYLKLDPRVGPTATAHVTFCIKCFVGGGVKWREVSYRIPVTVGNDGGTDSAGKLGPALHNKLNK